MTSIEGEISKLKTAVAHIEQSKEAAIKAVNEAETTNKEFKEHLQRVTADVDSILKPHTDLIASTEKQTKTIEAIDFPNRLDKQEKQISFLKIFLFITIGLIVIGTIVTILKK